MPDASITELLTRHLGLIRAAVPSYSSERLASMHMLLRCDNLQVELLHWRKDPAFPLALFEQLHQIAQQHDTSALMLQLQLAVLLQRALRP